MVKTQKLSKRAIDPFIAIKNGLELILIGLEGVKVNSKQHLVFKKVRSSINRLNKTQIKEQEKFLKEQKEVLKKKARRERNRRYYLKKKQMMSTTKKKSKPILVQAWDNI